MPYVKISELPEATTPLSGSELVEIVQGGTSKKVSYASLRVDVSDLRDEVETARGTSESLDARLDAMDEDIASAGSGTGGHTIADEGTALTARPKLNFTGGGVTVTDDPVNDSTVIQIPGGSASGAYELFASGRNITIDPSTYIVITDLDTENYDYTVRMRLHRESGGSVEDTLYAQFGGIGDTPTWYSGVLFESFKGDFYTPAITNGLAIVGFVGNATTLTMGTEMQLMFGYTPDIGEGSSISCIGQSYMWERLFRLNGTLDQSCGSMRFKTASQAWTASYSVYRIAKYLPT